MQKHYIDYEREQRRAVRRRKLREGLDKARDWLDRNRELAIAVSSVAVYVTGTVAKTVSRENTARREEKMRDRCFWDPTVGHWTEARRKLKPREQLEYDKRRSLGESASSILNSMGLLR